MMSKISARFGLLCGSALLASSIGLTASADQVDRSATLVVSRIQYVPPTPAPSRFRRSSMIPMSVASKATFFSITTSLLPARPFSAHCRLRPLP
jgi:hypothetical protein